MLANRNDPLPRRLMVTALVILNVIAIREEYLKSADLSWMSLLFFIIGLVIITWCIRPKKP